MKLSPFFTALAHVASALDAAGADGLVLFNRFYQPDIDVEEGVVNRSPDARTRVELALGHARGT